MKKTLRKLKQDIDKARSEYIRRREANWKDEVQCFTCSKTLHWKQVHAGHFHLRQHDWTTELGSDERNIQPQCAGCNNWMRGRPQLFATALQRKYGPDILGELEQKYHTPKKWKYHELEDLLEEYKNKTQNL